jgi:hypothetical protein
VRPRHNREALDRYSAFSLRPRSATIEIRIRIKIKIKIKINEEDSMEASHEFWFDHEKREVYREAIALIPWLSEMLMGLIKRNSTRDYNQGKRPA